MFRGVQHNTTYEYKCIWWDIYNTTYNIYTKILHICIYNDIYQSYIWWIEKTDTDDDDTDEWKDWTDDDDTDEGWGLKGFEYCDFSADESNWIEYRL